MLPINISMTLISIHRSVNVEYDVIHCHISEHVVRLQLFFELMCWKKFSQGDRLGNPG
jgi:hypothetical protein